MDICIHFSYGSAFTYNGDKRVLANPMPRSKTQKEWDAVRYFPLLETIEEEIEEVFAEGPQHIVSEKKKLYKYDDQRDLDICVNFTYGPALAYYGDGIHLVNPMPRCETQKEWDTIRYFPKFETIEEEEDLSEDEDIPETNCLDDESLIYYYDGDRVGLTNQMPYLDTQEEWYESRYYPKLETIEEEDEEFSLEGKRTSWDAKFTFGSAYIYRYYGDKIALIRPMFRLDSQKEWEDFRYCPVLKTIEEENEEVLSEAEGPQNVIVDDENIISEDKEVLKTIEQENEEVISEAEGPQNVIVDDEKIISEDKEVLKTIEEENEEILSEAEGPQNVILDDENIISEDKEGRQDKKKSKGRRVKSFLEKMFRPLFCCCVGVRAREEGI